jgi:hypothetical protein
MLRQLLGRRRLTTVAPTGSAILAAGLLASLAIAVPAAQANTDPGGWSSVSICWDSGTGLCLWTSGQINSDNSTLQNRTYSAGGIAQTWSTHSADTTNGSSTCNGSVTSSCPFDSTSLDQALINDPIVTIENDHYGYCMDDEGGLSPYLNSCSGANGEVWVMEPNGDGHWSLINVTSTNSQGGIRELQGIDKIDGLLPDLADCDTQGCGQYENWAAHS